MNTILSEQIALVMASVLFATITSYRTNQSVCMPLLVEDRNLEMST